MAQPYQSGCARDRRHKGGSHAWPIHCSQSIGEIRTSTHPFALSQPRPIWFAPAQRKIRDGLHVIAASLDDSHRPARIRIGKTG